MSKTNRLGPLPAYDYEDKTDWLADWVANTGQGVMGFQFGDVPPGCLEFCLSQYDRFKVTVPDLITEVVIAGACASLYYLDCVDPYSIFSGISDVDMTDDWSQYAYEILDNGRVYEADPSSIETFRFIPGQSDAVFDNVMSHPGLDALPHGIGHGIRDVIDGEWGSDCCYTLTTEAERLLRSMCRTPDGVVNKEMFSAYFELAAWSAAAWTIGPPGRDHRYRHHDIFHVALNCGEAVLIDGTVLDPRYYRKLPRAPKSCMICGLAAWCVEMTASATTTRYMCEHCLSQGMPPSTMATCGSKRCLLTACVHHPYHHLGSAGIHQTRRDFGQLGASAKGDSALRIRGGRQCLT